MRLLVPTPHDEPTERTWATLKWLGDHRTQLSSNFVEVETHVLKGWPAYYEWLAKEWDGKDLWVMLEHDVVPDSVSTLVDLSKCIEPICAVPYEAHQEYWPKDRGRPHFAGTSCSAHLCDPGFSVFAQKCECGRLREITPFDQFAARAGLGCIKFSPLVRNPIPWAEAATNRVGDGPDTRVFNRLAESKTPVRVHIHWPGGKRGALLVHNHAKCAGDV